MNTLFWILVVIFSGGFATAQAINTPMTLKECEFVAELQKTTLENQGRKVDVIKCLPRLVDVEVEFESEKRVEK